MPDEELWIRLIVNKYYIYGILAIKLENEYLVIKRTIKKYII